jgi:hypothetical protein
MKRGYILRFICASHLVTPEHDLASERPIRKVSHAD